MRSKGAVLVVAAVSQELRDFHEQGQSVERMVTGMGRLAGDAVRKRLAKGGIDLVISTGFAGGLRPGFRTGDLVWASEVIDAESGERRRPSAPEAGMEGIAETGPFITVKQVLPDSKAKSDAGRRFDAIAADMESSAVARAADQAGVPWIAVRAILDPMEAPLSVGSMGQFFRLALVPARWKQLSDFVGSVETAGGSLTEGLNRLISRRRSDGSG